MTCKRCGCTPDNACPGGCAWILPDLCTSCVTPEEAAIDKAYASMVEGLRAELEQDRFERFLLAVTHGMAANSELAELVGSPPEFVLRAFNLALALSEASAPEVEDEDDASADDPASRLVVP